MPPRGFDARARARGWAGPVAVGPVVGLGLLTGLGLLSGCGGSSGPAPTPSGTPVHESPWPQPTPTPTATPVDPAAVAPERPAAMDTVDDAGAAATARYFLELVPYAEATGDTTALSSLTHPDCVFCTSTIDWVAEATAAGRHSTGGLPHFSAVNALEVDPGAWWTVDLDLVQDPIEVLDQEGAVVDELRDALAYHMDIAVIRDGQSWLIRAVDYDVIGQDDA